MGARMLSCVRWLACAANRCCGGIWMRADTCLLSSMSSGTRLLPRRRQRNAFVECVISVFAIPQSS